MRIGIFCEGGGGLGYGHITRCVSLAQAFEEEGCYPVLIIDGSPKLKNVLGNIRFSNAAWTLGGAQLRDYLDDCDIAVFDSYRAEKKIYDLAADQVKLCVFIDDNMRLDYPKGVLINSSPGAETESIRDDPNRKLLLGPRYQPLRREFWDTTSRNTGGELKSLLVTFGGEDIRGLTGPVTEAVSDAYPGVDMHVVLGAFADTGWDETSAPGRHIHCVQAPTAAQMLDVMRSCDAAVSAGGQTVFELLSLGVPTIAVVVADNQKNNIRSLESAGVLLNAGEWDDPEFLDGLIELLGGLQDADSREKISDAARGLINGGGSRRIVAELLREFGEGSE
jgi:spore coat polysaccharide biosynthesis predicted glycosyltransferase SpsG